MQLIWLVLRCAACTHVQLLLLHCQQGEQYDCQQGQRVVELYKAFEQKYALH